MPVKKSAAKKSAVKKPAAKKPAAKKTVARKPAPPAGPADSAAAADTELHATVYTLQALLQRTASGPAITPEQVMLYIDVPTDQLVEIGQQVRTERIDIDSARLYGTAYDFATRATPEQLTTVPALTRLRLRVCIWAAAEGQRQNRAALAARSQAAAAQGLRATDAQQVKAEGCALRRVLQATLFALSGGQKLRTDELRAAYGRSEKPQDLADSLLALANLLDRYLGDPDSKITARRAEMQLDGRLSEKARALAQQVLLRVSSEKAPRTATATPNAQVDLWDGINLLLLDQLITIFEAGHELDPTVPRLIPQSLRSWFGRSKAGKPEPSQPDGEDAPAIGAG